MSDSRRRADEEKVSKVIETEQAGRRESDDVSPLTDDQLDAIAGGVLIVPIERRKSDK